MQPLTIYCNFYFPPNALELLRQKTSGHRLIFADGLQKSNLVGGSRDPKLAEADIALGQPDPDQSMELPRLRWAHLTSAGYTRYDRDDLRKSFSSRGVALTNSSAVYSEPCAEHLAAMILGMARRLPHGMVDQLGSRPWKAAEHRIQCHVLAGQKVLILGYGSIAARLVELLGPFRMNITAVRRKPNGDEKCAIIPTDRVDELLPLADHVVNILPANASTNRFLDARRLALISPHAFFYNIGRGTTVDQAALVQALHAGKIAGAYLDVTDPEPPPPTDPVWSAPNCFLTPHTAGGRAEEFESLVAHFLDNLERFQNGKSLLDRVV